MAPVPASFRRHTPLALFWLAVLAVPLVGGCDRAERTATSPSGGSQPGLQGEPRLEGEEGGVERVSTTASPAPWLRTGSDCPPDTTTIYITGLIQDMSTGEASCSRTVLACGDSLETTVEYNSNTANCPFAEGTTLAFSIEGPPVCCRAWEDAKASKEPCDPLVDADCDGTPNDEDSEPLTPGHSA